MNVLSFSLFGNDPLYCETAILNARALPEVYPDWQMRVYHDESVPEHVLQRLRAHQVQLFDVRTIGIAHWPGTFWRFHACTDAHIARVQFRDAGLHHQRARSAMGQCLGNFQVAVSCIARLVFAHRFDFAGSGACAFARAHGDLG